jgi:hypothetical protein
MKGRTSTIQEATHAYEAWLAQEITLVAADLERKHERMAAEPFAFLRATYYRWAHRWPAVCSDLVRAPQVLAVGDLHVENFGTWRDSEGRLIWGINDFDETTTLPYTHDLVRLATSAHMAIGTSTLRLSTAEADEALLTGYREALEAGGRPFVLAEHSTALRQMATQRLRDPQPFWQKLDDLPTHKGDIPRGAIKALTALLPHPDLPRRVVFRVAGLGSLGRERYVALADWHGGKIAREAKALAPSAASWAHGARGETKILYQTILDRSIRCPDPWVRVKRRWIVRRLAPDCSRIELGELGVERDEIRLLHAMGWETANVHLGSRSAHALLVDLASREEGWLHHAAKLMLGVVHEDWDAWRQSPVPVAAVEKKAPSRSKREKAAKAAKAAKRAKAAKATKAAKAAKASEAAKSAKTAKTAKTSKKAAKAVKSKKAAKSGKAAAAPKVKKRKAKKRKTGPAAAIQEPAAQPVGVAPPQPPTEVPSSGPTQEP